MPIIKRERVNPDINLDDLRRLLLERENIALLEKLRNALTEPQIRTIAFTNETGNNLQITTVDYYSEVNANSIGLVTIAKNVKYSINWAAGASELSWETNRGLSFVKNGLFSKNVPVDMGNIYYYDYVRIY